MFSLKIIHSLVKKKMITLFNGLEVDTTLLSFAAFIYILALVAIFKMHDSKKAFLFLLYISASSFLIFLFVKYSFISSLLVLFYIGHLLYNNGSKHTYDHEEF